MSADPFRPADALDRWWDAWQRGEAPVGMLTAALAMVALCVYFGFDTTFSVGGAQEAAQLLRGTR